MTGSTGDDVLLRVEGRLGRITLNRPKALNALTAAMVDAMAEALDAWAGDDRVLAVLIDGAGDRGLCAGGDLRALYAELSTGRTSDAEAFLAREYRLNARIAAYPKPYVAFMDGIVMGGGIGVSAHGRVRLVTERSALAMPETSLGLFPDVGGTFLLARAPGELGTHIALTARRFGAADSILLGFADRCVAAGSCPAITAALGARASAEPIGAAIDPLLVEPPPGTLAGQRDWIDGCYGFDSVEEILASLDAHADPEARKAAAEIRRNSPTALKVTLRALREARTSPGLEACLEREYRMAVTALRGQEFIEGVRAAVIDKDGAPRWDPVRLEDVEPALVASYFISRASSLGFEIEGKDL